MRGASKRNIASGEKRKDIRDVAKRARVSQATASRALNHVPTVAAHLAARVWKAAEELNYLPNTQARALVSGKSRMLGLIVSEITNPFFPELIQEMEAAAVESGYELLIASTNYDPADMASCARRMLERKVDGLAVMTFGIERPIVEELAMRRIPMVFMDAGPNLLHISSLQVDYRSGIREGVQHLASLGHREIAFVSGPLHLLSASSRRDAFLEAMKTVGLPVRKEWMLEGDHTLDGGKAATEVLLQCKRLPTALMSSNDMTAIGILHGLYERQLRVPDDFSVIGFDDVHMARFMLPPLTSVQMSCRRIARAAVAALRGHIEGATVTATAPIETRLVVRKTTARPRTNGLGASAKTRLKKQA
jgi:DNA-binding LacI/PurR family transcriptional regulator